MAFAFTDMGNAERFLKDHAQSVRYCSKLKMWFVWNGKRWVEDGGENEIIDKAKQTVRAIPKEVKSNPLLKKDILAHAHRSEAFSRINAMVRLARSASEVQIEPERFDADPWLLNCPNGILDLKTGKLRLHKPESNLTLMCGTKYQPKAKAPQFMKFLSEIMAGDEQMVDFLQRVFGYALTGSGREQCLFFLIGSGLNGKTTLIETLRKVFGSYARHTPTATLIRNGLAIRNDLARLRGARFVTAAEVSRGNELDEATTKMLTGEDPVASRFLYREFFEYRPNFKLFLVANHTPEIRGSDFGIWRRILLIPFSVTIPQEKVNKELPLKLNTELPGILAWLVEGCLKWQKDGLRVPVKVKEATEEYREEADFLGQFLEDCCRVNKESKVRSKELYEAYRCWAVENRDEILTKKAFGSHLKTAGFKASKSNSARYWNGLQLKIIAESKGGFSSNTKTEEVRDRR